LRRLWLILIVGLLVAQDRTGIFAEANLMPAASYRPELCKVSDAVPLDSRICPAFDRLTLLGCPPGAMDLLAVECSIPERANRFDRPAALRFSQRRKWWY